ncbi:hypothetical protein, partial [uncultured Oscillibacter sp.]|uniref:hypothetical protein n=1 Tax=uncultured Oscillibacter sp. TaxID=876091 RepID=UPI00272AF7B8
LHPKNHKTRTPQGIRATTNRRGRQLGKIVLDLFASALEVRRMQSAFFVLPNQYISPPPVCQQRFFSFLNIFQIRRQE